jgi:sugar lactone lactonase YvrE
MANGDYSVAVQDPAMLANAPPGVPAIGINGMKIQNGHLFFANLVQGTLCKIPIDPRTGAATGPVEVITSNIAGADDFALDSSSTAYVAVFPAKELVAVKPNGEVVVLAGDIVGPTSAAFGRTAGDCKTIYVSTSGAIFGPSGVTPVEGGRVMAVKLR